MKEEVLKEIERIGFEEVTTRLLAFANALLKKRFWQTGKASGPKGEEPEDFVQTAILKSLTDWNWSKDTEPEIMGFLKSIIESLVSNAITGGDNIYASKTDLHSVDLNLSTNTPTSDMLLDGEALEKRLDLSVRASIRGDEDRIVDVYDAMKLEYQSKDIATLCDMSVEEVSNYKKRVRYCLKHFKKPAK
jgi:DNA-directed RNA polymerase specialized sigma24 family protein